MLIDEEEALFRPNATFLKTLRFNVKNYFVSIMCLTNATMASGVRPVS
jgi:hypothetical protein